MKKPPKVRVSVLTASCVLYASQPMFCPLCNVHVPPYTNHACVKKESK